MNSKELLDLIKLGEGYNLEFKESLNNISNSICAFSNSSGGKILVGIKDNGNVVGFNLTNKKRSQIQTIARNIDPFVDLDIDYIDNIAVIDIKEGKNKPYRSSSGFYKRKGANTQKLTTSEIRTFFENTNQIQFDKKENIEFDINTDFDNNKFENFKQKLYIEDISKEHILKNLKLITNNKINNAGVLLFSHRISKFFLNSIVTCVLYQGIDNSKMLDKKDFDADFISNFNNTVNFILKNININQEIKGLERIETPEIPEKILREVVTNAFIHRNYFSEGRIIVSVYKDRIEIINPGNLLFNKKDLGTISVLRNPILADIAHRLNLGDRIGSGINKIKKLKKRVTFDISITYFKVIISRVIVTTPHATPHGTPHVNIKIENTLKILEFCKIERSRIEIQDFIGINDRKYFRKEYIRPLLLNKYLVQTLPNKLKSPNQKYIITKEGLKYLK